MANGIADGLAGPLAGVAQVVFELGKELLDIARLEEADAIASVIIEDHTAALTELAMEVARHRTLEGKELSQVLDRVRQRLQGWSP